MKLLAQCILLIAFSLFAKINFAQDSLTFQANQPIRFTKEQCIAPAFMVGTGLLFSGSIKNEIVDWRNKNLSGFYTNADDVLALAPITFVYGLDLIGVPARNDFWNRSAILFKSELMMLGSVYLLKYTTAELRPDGSDYRSFPSGHTAQAFLSATFLSQEYGRTIKWIPYAAYTVASSVALLRMANNRHYIGDVLVGAGIGLLSQKIAYWTHQYRWGRNVPKPILKF